MEGDPLTLSFHIRKALAIQSDDSEVLSMRLPPRMGMGNLVGQPWCMQGGEIGESARSITFHVLW